MIKYQSNYSMFFIAYVHTLHWEYTVLESVLCVFSFGSEWNDRWASLEKVRYSSHMIVMIVMIVMVFKDIDCLRFCNVLLINLAYATRMLNNKLTDLVLFFVGLKYQLQCFTCYSSLFFSYFYGLR